MIRLQAGEPMTRRRLLALGVGGVTAAILAACGLHPDAVGHLTVSG